VLDPYPAQFDESSFILFKAFLKQGFLHSATTVSDFKINFGGVAKMRVIVLRKQEEIPMDKLPPEARQEVEEVMEDRQEVFDEISDSIGELNRTIIENLNRIPVETLERVRDLVQEAVNTASTGATAGALRKGEIAIFTDTDLDALKDLVEAVEELTHPERGAPAFSGKDAGRLLSLVEKAKESLEVIEEQLREGVIKVEEELRKQEEGEGLDSPEGVVEQDPIDRIEILVSQLMSAMALLENELEDIDHNLELLSNPEERSVFVKEGWFERKIRSIGNRLHEIEGKGRELISHLQTLRGEGARRPWKR
jgi:hypothetical protein